MSYFHPVGRKSIASRHDPHVGQKDSADVAQAAIPDDAIDLFGVVITLARNWKTLLAVMAVVGVAGLVLVSQTPRQYRASAMLRSAASDQLPLSDLLSAARPKDVAAKASPAVLQQYAEIVRDDETLRQAAGGTRLEDAPESASVLNELRSSVMVIPSKDGSGIEVAATCRDAAQAKRLLDALVAQGVESVDAARRREIDSMAERLTAERKEALQAFRKKQKEVEALRQEKAIDAKQGELNELSRRLFAARQSESEAQRAIVALEARITVARALLDNPPSGQDGRQEARRLAELRNRLALELNVSPLVLHDLEAEFGSEHLARGWLRLSLARDRVALGNARQEIEQSKTIIPSLLEDIENRRAELTVVRDDLQFVEWDLGRVRDDYLASARAVDEWRRDSDQQLPALVRERSLEGAVRPVGPSRSTRVVLVSIVAFALGCLVVLARESLRRRAAPERRAVAIPKPDAATSRRERVPA